MRTNKFLWALPCLTLLFTATLSSCSEKDDDQPVTKHHFLMSAQADNGFFITSFENLNEGTSVSYDKAITLPTGHLYCLEQYYSHCSPHSTAIFSRTTMRSFSRSKCSICSNIKSITS